MNITHGPEKSGVKYSFAFGGGAQIPIEPIWAVIFQWGLPWVHQSIALLPARPCVLADKAFLLSTQSRLWMGEHKFKNASWSWKNKSLVFLRAERLIPEVLPVWNFLKNIFPLEAPGRSRYVLLLYGDWKRLHTYPPVKVKPGFGAGGSPDLKQ